MSAEPLAGVLVGHAQAEGRPTGATAILLPPATTVGVAVRGAAPGTRETDLLDPVNTVEHADAIVLAGGSAYGLDAASGVQVWLEENGRGIDTGVALVPIVPSAVIFDLDLGDSRVRPDTQTGRAACLAAVPLAQAAQGNVGAGSGASVGKLLGPHLAMRGGLGIASASAAGFSMAAVIVVNAVGDIVDPASGRLIAGARRHPDSMDLADSTATLLSHPFSLPMMTTEAPGPARVATTRVGQNTTVGAVITDAPLTKTQASRLAQVAHDGLARAIRPAHTALDGDTIFAAATGASQRDEPLGMADHVVLATLAAEVTSAAILSGVRAATSLRLGDIWLPSCAGLPGPPG